MNRYFKSFLAVALITGVGLSMRADDVKLPVVELLGNYYYVYKAKKGDSLFGIARTYGWNDSTLQQLNPSAVSPLKKGMKIYYPAPDQRAPKAVAPPVSENDTELKHIVKRGETVYAISNMYGVSVDRIYLLNPDSRNGIKAGETLLVRKAGASPKSSDGSQFYTVKNGDTLYGVAHEFGVSVAAVMRCNPGVDEHSFKAGSNIRIPARGTGIEKKRLTVEVSDLDSMELHEVSKKETWSSIASANGVSVETLREANPDVTELKNKDYIAVPRIETVSEVREVDATDPREIEPGGIEEIYQDVHKIAGEEEEFSVRIAVVTEDADSNKDIEFLRGFLTGVDKQKNSGTRILFKVIDGKSTSETVITALDEFKPSMVFMTADGDIPSYLAEYASVSQTPVVNTFDVKSGLYETNPYVIQLLTPSTFFNENIATYVHDNFASRTLVFVGEPDDNDILAESLKKVWDSSRIRTSPIAGVTSDFFAEDGKYLVYCNPVKKKEVTELLDQVIAAREECPMADISFLGRPNLILFEESLDNKFHQADAMIPSRFYIDRESTEYKEFVQDFKSLFNRTPIKSLPLYAAVGYDTSNYFIPALSKSRGDLNKLNRSKGTVQSNFDLVRTSNWGGFLNPPVFMIRFTPFDTVEKNVIDYVD